MSHEERSDGERDKQFYKNLAEKYQKYLVGGTVIAIGVGAIFQIATRLLPTSYLEEQEHAVTVEGTKMTIDCATETDDKDIREICTKYGLEMK